MGKRGPKPGPRNGPKYADPRGYRPLSARGNVGGGSRSGASGSVQRHFPGPRIFMKGVWFSSWYTTPVGQKWRTICRINARNKAYRIVKNMEKDVEFADSRAKLVMEKMVEIVIDQCAKENPRRKEAGYDEKAVYEYSAKDRIAAMKAILEYTQSKPEAKTKVTVATAEDWLAGLDD